MESVNPAPVFVNNLMVDNRYGIRQPGKDGADIDNSVLSPNYFFASTNTGVKQQSKDFKMIVWDANNLTSHAPEDLSKLFIKFTQNDKMNINCERDDPANGAPLKWNPAWDFHLQPGVPQLTGAFVAVKPNFPSGLAFFGMKRVKWVSNTDDQNYYFSSSVASNFFGAFGTK